MSGPRSLEDPIDRDRRRVRSTHRIGPPPPWLRRVQDTLHDRYDQVVRVGELARAAGVHPVHMARVFKRHHGCTVGEYQRRIRVERACTLLDGRDVSLAALALRTGFADQAHFTRRFKEVVGVSPGEYRRRARTH